MPPKSSPRKSSPKKSSPRKSPSKVSSVKRMISSVTPAQKKKILAAAAVIAGATAAYKTRSAYKAGKFDNKITKAKASKVGTKMTSMFSYFPFRKKQSNIAPGTNPDNFLG